MRPPSKNTRAASSFAQGRSGSGRLRRCTHLLLILLATGLATPLHADETAKIDQAELLQRIDAKDPSLIVLDVRTPEEFAAGHVPGAINIPHAQLPARLAELPSASTKDIVIYCATGVRAAMAASRLRENGYTRLLHLDGDMRQWRENGRPIRK